MKRVVVYVLTMLGLSLMLLWLASCTSGEIDIDNLRYELVWNDEFDYEGPPDPDKWGYDVGGSGWGNNELQYYTNEGNAWVDGEKLVIEARNEQIMHRQVSSARLVTKGNGDWLYGKIEVRAKLPVGLGTWPAIWMLPTDRAYGGWPASGEIDIMEHVGYDYGRVHATVHTAAYNHMKGTQKGDSKVLNDVETAFHVYSVEWLPDRLRFFIDEEEVFVFKPDALNDDASEEITDKQWPFDQPFHLIMNIAFGGSWGGANGVDYEVLPVTMDVDYVRVYQSKTVTKWAEDNKRE